MGKQIFILPFNTTYHRIFNSTSDYKKSKLFMRKLNKNRFRYTGAYTITSHLVFNI